jgi:hypothetical protein
VGTIRIVPRDFVAEYQQLRAYNEGRLVALVGDHPGELSVETDNFRLMVTPNTVRNALKRGVVVRRDHRLWPK